MSYKSQFRHITISDFYCVYCGHKGTTVARTAGHQREPGHLKKLWCTNCELTVNFAEVRGFGNYTKADFDFEFTYHNFNNHGERIEPNYKKFIQNTLNKIEKGELPETDAYYKLIRKEQKEKEKKK